MSTPNRDAAAFFARADPHLYRRNPFRVADLSVHATARDVRRRTEELRVKARLGADTGADTGGGTGLLPLRRRPAPDSVQDALQRLRDPVRRIEDELFWFWPAHNEAVEGARDEALDALRERRIHDAERLWAEPGPGRAAAVAAHNLAVLKHAQALDGYLDADTAADGPGGRDLWKPALRHWRTVLDTDAFWDLVAARARAANDPRLGPGTADELRERLPAVLLRIAADAAVRTSLGGDTLGGFALTGVIRTSGYDEAAVEAAFRAATAPEMERLRTLARSALDRATESPETACDEAVRILDHSTAPLDALDEILTPAHPLMEGVRDEIAERVQQCTIVYGNETKDWSKSEEILGRAGEIAATVTVKTRIKKNLDTAGDNLLYGTCWFCGDTPADDDATYEKKMYGNVREEFGGYGGYQRQIRWQKLAVPVPRCSGCAAAHRDRGRKVAGVGCGFGAAALALAVALIVAGAPPLLPVGLIFLVIIGFFVVMGTGNIDGLPKNAHATLGAWPPIQERLGAGWLFGEKPPNLD
ncbi:hypothetical protein BJF79_09275 [Actinomadura sp. CNU-125]|uniref:hypothetical protein n=1 Tax=Actinomadura sp. CNU-125 TaxID=1904961 RepID=UPI00096264E9|nr:hypothetical protein [Actinomadura sp. CNU-125]OLT30784.1 hypothetical protein BJF79_09275 [Actinomadura sp. CNU-125]